MIYERYYQNFINKVDKNGPNGCWVWRGARAKVGYGLFWYGVPSGKAYRFSYEYFNQKKVKKGMCIDHLCDNKQCVNPDHLKETTNKENVLRGNGITAKFAKQTHCIHGHPLSGKNLRMQKLKSGGWGRHCRTCTAVNNKNTRLRYPERFKERYKKWVASNKLKKLKLLD